MKNYWILLIFLQFLIKKANNQDTIKNLIFKAKCEDDKAKTGACMYYLKDNVKVTTEYAIFDKCGKGKNCKYDHDNDIYFKCSKKEIFERRKSGQSCNYHEDCYSNSCVSNKCTLASEGEICVTTIQGPIGCEAGLVCEQDLNSDKSKCYKLAKEGEENKYGCFDGLVPNIENKCKKYGTLNDGDKIPYCDNESRLLCKSGICVTRQDEHNNPFYICASLTTEPTCSKAEISSQGKVTSKGEWSDKTEIPVNARCEHAQDYTGADIYYYQNSKLQSKLFQDFLEDYNDLDLEKINSDENKSLRSSLKWKSLEKLLLYENAPELFAAGLIDSDGKRKDNKKCEYDFIIKNVLNSNFIKFNTLIIFMIALLF